MSGPFQTLENMAAAALHRPPEQPAIEFEGRWYCWGEMRVLADRLGAAIDAAGPGPQPIDVAFVPRNHPAFIAGLLSLIARGCGIRMVYAFQSATGIARDLGALRAPLTIIDQRDYSPELHQQAATLLALDGMRPVEISATSGVAGDSAHARAIEILTSGTTGAPKRFAITYDMIATHLVQGNTSVPGQDLSALPPTLLYFPLGNITGLYSTLPALLRGQRAVLLERFSVDAWRDYVKRYRPQATGLPPSAVQTVLDAGIPREDLSGVQYLGTGAAPLDPSVQRAFEERYGIPILLSYGATEFGGPVVSMTPALHREWGPKKLGSVGRALPGVKLRVIDPDAGVELAAGREGLLEVISPRIGPDWIRTMDVAVVDEDGFVFLRGRADAAIMRGGFKLLPETIERALLQHPAIAAASVVGIDDRRLGQVPVAAVECRPGRAPVDPVQLEAHLRDHVYATHIPVKWRIVDALPRTPSLKIDRRAVQQLFESN